MAECRRPRRRERLAFVDDLAGTVAVVTGAASGIGLALAGAFAAEGMKLVLADVEAAELEGVCDSLRSAGAEAVAVPTDVSDPEAVEALREAALRAFGGVHVVCNNAGVGVGGPLWEVPLEAFEWVMGVNFWGVVHGIRTFVPHLVAEGVGHVVNTASAAGLVASPFLGPYTVSKFGVVALSETLAMELAGSGVGVSVLCPLWVRTRIHESGRNAPPAAADAMERGGDLAAAGREMVGQLVEAGLAPEVVARKVVAAVKEGTFWVLPHKQVLGALQRRVDTIIRGETPSTTIFG